jgi:hypothetical protein
MAGTCLLQNRRVFHLYRLRGSRFTGIMKKVLRHSVGVFLGIALWLGYPVLASEAVPPPLPKSTTSGSPALKTPGVEIAQAISTITGVAISPLLGVGAIGAWKYWQAPVDKRPNLPWFAQPWFWAPALVLVGLVFLKDTAGAALPTALKKPLDIAEVFENKISALVAAGVFIPLIANIMESAGGKDGSLYQGMMLASFDPVVLWNLLTVPLAIVAFFVVWMVAHVINVLIIVSPFSSVDAALKAVRLAILSSVTFTSFANPYVGAAWAVIIIIVCYFLSGWALRLTIFGTVFAWDFLTFRSSRTKPDAKENWAFTAGAIDKTPIRSFGRLTRDEKGQLVLKYRPWLVLPAQQLSLTAGSYAVGRGLLYPEILRLEPDSTQPILTLPPRYCGHEEEFNQIYALAGVRNVGIKALWDWLKAIFRSKPEVTHAA